MPKAATIIATGLALAQGGCATAPVGGGNAARIVLFDRTAALPAISMAAVPEVVIAAASGIDVQSKSIAGPGFQANATYGMSGGQQACGSLPQCRLGTARISGRSASFVRYLSTADAQARPFSHVFVGYLPVGQGRSDEPGSGLTFSGHCAEPAGCDALQRLFESLSVEG